MEASQQVIYYSLILQVDSEGKLSLGVRIIHEGGRGNIFKHIFGVQEGKQAFNVVVFSTHHHKCFGHLWDHLLIQTDFWTALAETAHYAGRDPIIALTKYIMDNKLASEQELKTTEKEIYDILEKVDEFADASSHPPRRQLLGNVFVD